MGLKRTDVNGKALTRGQKRGPKPLPLGHPDRRLDADVAKRKKRFLQTFAKDGTISGTCRLTKIGRQTHYDWLREDPAYAEGFADACEDAADMGERELIRRGIHGIDEPIFYKGEHVATIRKYSDACLIFWMKGRRPSVFRDRAELTGADGGPIQFSWMDDEEPKRVGSGSTATAIDVAAVRKALPSPMNRNKNER